MSWRVVVGILAIQVSLVQIASAGIFFNRTKPDPVKRVPELVGILKGDASESRRAAAAAELRDYDPKAYPEIVPVLKDAAQRDPQADVRAEAVASLGKLRPVTQEVGALLEQVHTSDASSKVRWQARTALWQYQLAGYRSGKSEGPSLTPPTTSQEPPLAAPDSPPAPRPAPQAAPAAPTTTGYRPVPSSMQRMPPVPAQPPILQTPPSTDGPMLNGPR